MEREFVFPTPPGQRPLIRIDHSGMRRMNARCFLLLSALSFAPMAASGQVIPAYDLGGASKPKPELSFRKAHQYKRVHQASLRLILRGELDKTEAFLSTYLADHPNDAETLYMLGILAGRRGNIQRAESWMERALSAGLPGSRLLAGPRKIVAPLAATRLMERLRTQYRQRLVHGPLVGAVRGDAAAFWVRTAEESTIEVVVTRVGDESHIRRSPQVRSRAETDYTAVARIDGLRPKAEYRYDVWMDGALCAPDSKQTFRTLPAAGEASTFVIAFGGGAGYAPENERMWDTIQRYDPQAILLLGDNVYIDDPESLVMQQYTYQRRQSRPEWKRLTARSPVFSIWDDHDFSTNDSWGGPDIDVPFWKKEWVYPTFQQNWANPSYGGGDAQPGCWYSFRIGDVDFIMLDCRYYRTDPRQQPHSMLGPVQKQWLKNQLASARGTFKVLCSSVPWDYRTKGDSLDTWNGYREEREEIFGFIEQRRIEGVLLMSADRHRSDAWRIDRPRGYDLYEFNSSRLTNNHRHATMLKNGALFSYNELQSFGLVRFDTTLTDPQVTYDVVNINGEKPHSITIRRSQLTMPR